jgi:undecaprenyl-diphosphatase
MNMELFRIINNLVNKNIVLDKIMVFFSEYGPYISMGAIIIVFILGIKQRKCENRKIAVSTVVVTAINLIINIIIRSIIHVDRPFVHDKVNLLLPHDSASSFPSNHATGTMSIALGIEKYNKLLSVMLNILSIIIGFSRVYVGHHYPMDVIGAYVIVFVVNYIYNWKLRNKVNELYEFIENKSAIKFKLQKLFG